MSDERLRTQAHLWAWHAMRTYMPREHWSVTACDAIADAALDVARSFPDLPPEWKKLEAKR